MSTRKTKKTNREKDNIYWWTLFAFEIAIAHSELDEVKQLKPGSARAFKYFKEKVEESLSGHSNEVMKNPSYTIDDVSQAFLYLEQAEEDPHSLDGSAIDALVNLVGLRPSSLHKMFPHIPETQIRKVAKEYKESV